ncbi:MAG: hypothetical protein ACOCVR_01690 [Myxococcota bacterium]
MARALEAAGRRPAALLLGNESAQSSVEYAFIVSVTAISFWVGRPMWMALIEGLQIYFDSFYFLLRMPVP